ncbi:MAG: hypothetical protein LW855_05595 [Alphaproteobacteria bacterium]|jgi:hypothetical protein|nr:hypothetical protein [Thalassospira sp.]MCE2965249.1 hypothetical protein [Alphaproteobacteria bacterium]
MAKKRKPPAAPSAPKKQTRTERGAAAIADIMRLADTIKFTAQPEGLASLREEGRR